MDHSVPHTTLEELRAALERLKLEDPNEYLALLEDVNELLAELEKSIE